MTLHFEGERLVTQSIHVAWEKLNDARFLVRCIPDVEEVMRADPIELACRLRPGFAFVRGTLDLVLRVVEAVTHQSVRLELRTKGIGTASTILANIDFAAADAGTRLNWTAEVTELGGLLKAVPSGLIRAAAQKVIADSWNRAVAQLGADS